MERNGFDIVRVYEIRNGGEVVGTAGTQAEAVAMADDSPPAMKPQPPAEVPDSEPDSGPDAGVQADYYGDDEQ